MSGIGAGFLTGGGGLLFQAYDIASFCEIEVSYFNFNHLIEYTVIKNRIGLVICSKIVHGYPLL